jgi:hypothetical protein
VGRYGGVVVADRYEGYDAWKTVAAVGAGIAIGTMLAKPPAAAAPVAVSGTTYYYHDNVFYTRVMSGGDVSAGVARRGRHHDAAGGCQSDRRQRHLQCGRLLHRVRRISGRRAAMPEWRTCFRSHCCSPWRASGHACQDWEAGPWKGGGFGCSPPLTMPAGACGCS